MIYNTKQQYDNQRCQCPLIKAFAITLHRADEDMVVAVGIVENSAKYRRTAHRQNESQSSYQKTSRCLFYDRNFLDCYADVH